MSCKKCKHLAVGQNANGRRVVYARNAYGCVAPCPELPPLPDSITCLSGFRWPPARSYMSGDDGKGCPLFEPL